MSHRTRRAVFSFSVFLISFLVLTAGHAQEPDDAVQDPSLLDDSSSGNASETSLLPVDADPLSTDANAASEADSAGEGDTEVGADPSPESAPAAEGAASPPYALELDLSGDMTFTPREEERLGGLEDISIAYTLRAEVVIPTIASRQSLRTPAKIDTEVTGYLFNSNNIICELRLDIPEVETEITVIPKPKQEESPPELQIKIQWPKKIEETWESYCPISSTYAFVTMGELETPLQTLLGHSDPSLSSFVVSQDKSGFKEDFVFEFFDDLSDPVYETSGSGKGKLTITPKP